MKRIALALLMAITLTGCAQSNQTKIDVAVKATLTALAPTATVQPSSAPEPTCTELTIKWQADINPMFREWDDALALALQTPRSSMATPISNLQRIKRDIEDIQAPVCATQAKSYLTNYMDAKIKMLLAFSANSTDGSVDGAENRAIVAREAYMAELVTLINNVAPSNEQSSVTPVPTSPRDDSRAARDDYLNTLDRPFEDIYEAANLMSSIIDHFSQSDAFFQQEMLEACERMITSSTSINYLVPPPSCDTINMLASSYARDALDSVAATLDLLRYGDELDLSKLVDLLKRISETHADILKAKDRLLIGG